MLLSFNDYLSIKFKDKNKIKLLKNKRNIFIRNFCGLINKDYIEQISNDKHNKLLLYSINPTPLTHINNEIVGIVIYRIILYTDKLIRIYIPIISIHKHMRNKGYGSIIINELIEKFNNKNLEIVLLSLPSSKKFYEKLGFIEKNIKYIENKEVIDNNIMMVWSNNISKYSKYE